MLWSDFLNTIWNYRLYPNTTDATHCMWYIARENLLRRRETLLPYAGVVTALCEHHPDMMQEWIVTRLKEIIDKAYSVSRNRQAKADILWPEYVMMRWVVLGTDREAWDLLMLCHYAPVENQKMAAQTATDKICRSLTDGKAMQDSKGNLVGKTQFEDLRLQMLRLANEFRSMTTPQRKVPFELLSFTVETMVAQQEQRARLSPVLAAVPGSLDGSSALVQ